MKASWVLLVGLPLAGCKLVDQTTFAPSPEALPKLATSPNVDTRTPLVTIDYAKPNPNYQDVLRFAVTEAEKRAPGVNYDVTGMLPAGGDVTAAQRRVTEVMRHMMTLGVPAERIHLGLRSAPAGTPQEVRIYVR